MEVEKRLIRALKMELQMVQGVSRKTHSYSLSVKSFHLNSSFLKRSSKKERRSRLGIRRSGLSWDGQEISTKSLSRCRAFFNSVSSDCPSSYSSSRFESLSTNGETWVSLNCPNTFRSSLHTTS